MEQRNNPPKDVVKVGPSWLGQVSDDDSIAPLEQYKVLPLFKVIQAMTDESLKDRFKEGSIIVRPGDQLIAEKGEPFYFVPCFMFTEFCKWASIKDKESPAVLERTFDDKNDVAIRSRSPEKRKEPYPDGSDRSYRYVEHLNFPGVVYGNHPLSGQEVVLGFSRGEFFTGQSFCTSIQMRKVGGQVVPLWGQIWQLSANVRKRKGYSWYGIDFANPDGEMQSPYIENEEVESFQKAFQELKEQFQKNKLRAEYDREGDVEEMTEASAEM